MQNMKMEIMEYNGWECVICGDPATQLAHCIAQTKTNIKKYGKSVIHNWNNMLPVCSLYCNSRCNIGNNPAKTQKMLDIINEGENLPAIEIKHRVEI